MLRCAEIFTDHMVLLRDKRVCIWGECDNDNIITVSVDDTSIQTRAYAGKWKIYLPSHSAGGPYTLSVSDGIDEICFGDVMYGEVLLAAGQSNMELGLGDCSTGIEELNTSSYPDIRYFNTYKTGFVDETVLKEIYCNKWKACVEGSFGEMSAIAYYTAKTLYDELKVPVGIIDCYQGGTSIVSWLPEDVLGEYSAGRKAISDYNLLIGDKSDEEYEQEVSDYWEKWHLWDNRVKEYKSTHKDAKWADIEDYAGECPWPQPAGRKSVFRPSGCYESMIKRVAPYTVAGILYYQGETDACDAGHYYEFMDRLIREWRDLFENTTLPFVLTQLPVFIEKNESDDFSWAHMRDVQLAVYENIKNTELLVLCDCGEYGNIHPVDKKKPGERLGRLVLTRLYGRDKRGLAMFAKDIYRDGGNIRIIFDNTYGAIQIKGVNDEEEYAAFEVAGSDGVYMPCEYMVDCDGVLLYGRAAREAVTVRYAWFNYGKVRIFNDADIPLAPFGERKVR